MSDWQDHPLPGDEEIKKALEYMKRLKEPGAIGTRNVSAPITVDEARDALAEKR